MRNGHVTGVQPWAVPISSYGHPPQGHGQASPPPPPGHPQGGYGQASPPPPPGQQPPQGYGHPPAGPGQHPPQPPAGPHSPGGAQPSAETADSPQPPADSAPAAEDPVAKLSQLKTMLDQGLITQDDYDAAKAKVLGLS